MNLYYQMSGKVQECKINLQSHFIEKKSFMEEILAYNIFYVWMYVTVYMLL